MPLESDSSKLSIPQDVLFEVLDGEAVLLNLTTGTYFGLNRTGTRIWELICDHREREGVRRAMLEEFEVESGVLEPDVEALVGELLRRGLLVEA